MRKGQNTWFNYNENGFCAVSLGADYVAEHEWGIAGLRRQFEMNDSALGIAKRQAKKIPDNLQWIEQDKFSGIYCGRVDYLSYLLKNITHFDSNHLCTFWDENGFAIFSDDKEKIGNLRKIWDAFQVGNVAMWVGGGGVFQNGGLILAIVDKLPADKIKLLLDTDTERLELAEAMKKTGIEKKLKDADKRYFALSPKWNEKKELRLWLNPCEQNKNNCGYFSLKDLEDWIKGIGPIPKKK